jgi:hypothetical protein
MDRNDQPLVLDQVTTRSPYRLAPLVAAAAFDRAKKDDAAGASDAARVCTRVHLQVGRG